MVREYWENGELEKWHLDCDVIFDESLVREFWDNILNFRKVFMNKQFSEDFLREMLVPKTRFNNRWEWMELTQNLSEKFIEEFKDEWNWDHIFMYQKLSKDFIRKWKENISDYVMNETDIGTYL